MSFNKKVAQEMQDELEKKSKKITDTDDICDRFYGLGYNTALLDVMKWSWDKMVVSGETITISKLLDKLNSLRKNK